MRLRTDKKEMKNFFIKKENIVKMDFPDLINTNKEMKNINDDIYKNMLNKETKKIEKKEEGILTIKEIDNKIVFFSDKKEKQIEEEIDEEIEFYENIIKTQDFLDEVNEKYKERYINLYGIDEYEKNYMMTDSHLYDSDIDE